MEQTQETGNELQEKPIFHLETYIERKKEGTISIKGVNDQGVVELDFSSFNGATGKIIGSDTARLHVNELRQMLLGALSVSQNIKALLDDIKVFTTPPTDDNGGKEVVPADHQDDDKMEPTHVVPG